MSCELPLQAIAGLLGVPQEDRDKLRAVGAAMEEKGILPVLGTLVERWYTDAFIAVSRNGLDEGERLGLLDDLPLDLLALAVELRQTPGDLARCIGVGHIRIGTKMTPSATTIMIPLIRSRIPYFMSLPR